MRPPDPVCARHTGLPYRLRERGSFLSPHPCLHSKAEGAAAYCRDLVLDGAGGWRLPTVKELNTLIDEKLTGPAIDRTSFPDTRSEWYWSSSAYVGLSGYHWAVSFGDGASYINVSSKGIARCVK